MLLGGRDHDASVAASRSYTKVVFFRLCQFEHLVHDDLGVGTYTTSGRRSVPEPRPRFLGLGLLTASSSRCCGAGCFCLRPSAHARCVVTSPVSLLSASLAVKLISDFWSPNDISALKLSFAVQRHLFPPGPFRTALISGRIFNTCNRGLPVSEVSARSQTPIAARRPACPRPSIRPDRS
jgi:hypothetical protein